MVALGFWDGIITAVSVMVIIFGAVLVKNPGLVNRYHWRTVRWLGLGFVGAGLQGLWLVVEKLLG